jgi:hypothetical protein
MNLRRHAAILWRFRTIVIAALLLGVTMATLAVFKVTTTGISWRAQEVWSSESTVFVTQKGFPWGRVILPGAQAGVAAPTPAPGTEDTAQSGEAFADPQRFTNLAIVYSYLAQSDRVRALMNPRPRRAQLQVAPVAGNQGGETLPLLNVTTNAKSREAARRLNATAITALRRYLAMEQASNGIGSDDRVRIQVLNPPSAGTILVGRSKTPAIVAFLLVMGCALALIYGLENLYPRHPAGTGAVDDADDVLAAGEPGATPLARAG